jgi:phage baseplate assembly protein W
VQQGTDAKTGRALTGLDHLRQSITDILSTPVGSRVMLREYGSRLFSLVDRPTNASLITDLYAATAEAIIKWETRFKVTKVQVDLSEFYNGKIVLDLRGLYAPDGQVVHLDGITVELKAIT